MNFGSVPLMDLYLTHTFSDLFYPALYTMVNGYHGIDMLIWNNWMPEVVSVLVIYFFLARVVLPVFALLVTAALPVLGLVPTYYALALLPALFLNAARNRPGWGSWLGVWASGFLLFLWRIDFGLFGLVSLSLVVIFDAMGGRDIAWKKVLGAWSAVAGVLLFFLGGLALLSQQPMLETLDFFLHNQSLRFITTTRSQIITELNVLAVFQYYLLPAAALVYILNYALASVFRQNMTAMASMLSYVAFFSLAISVRSLERHSLVEHYNPYLFVVPVGLHGFPVSRKRRRPQILLGCGTPQHAPDAAAPWRERVVREGVPSVQRQSGIRIARSVR